MNSRDEAAACDARDQPIQAAHAYEAAIVTSDVDLALYLNLAVLYFVCNDGGYAAHHRLSTRFLTTAWERAFALPDEAEHRLGLQPELGFWKRYFQFILLGAPPFYAECERFVQSGQTLVPYVHLFTSPKGEQYHQQAEALLTAVQMRKTAKERYLGSVLEAAFRRYAFARAHPIGEKRP